MNPDLVFDEYGPTQSVEFQYPNDEEERAETREMLRVVMRRLLEFAFGPSRAGLWPSDRIVQQRLVVMGILIGVDSLSGKTLAEFARRHKISKSRATKIAGKVRRELGIDAYFISSRHWRESCRRAALARER